MATPVFSLHLRRQPSFIHPFHILHPSHSVAPLLAATSPFLQITVLARPSDELLHLPTFPHRLTLKSPPSALISSSHSLSLCQLRCCRFSTPRQALLKAGALPSPAVPSSGAILGSVLYPQARVYIAVTVGQMRRVAASDNCRGEGREQHCASCVCGPPDLKCPKCSKKP